MISAYSALILTLTFSIFCGSVVTVTTLRWRDANNHIERDTNLLLWS